MAVRPIPEGYHTVTPYLTVVDVDQQLEFVQAAFGARVHELMRDDNGKARHADVVIGDSHVMMGQARDEWKPMPASLYLYVDDVDAIYAKAIAAGGKSMREPTNEFYGDRSSGVQDANGNYWWISTHVEDVPPEEMERRAAAQGK